MSNDSTTYHIATFLLIRLPAARPRIAGRVVFRREVFNELRISFWLLLSNSFAPQPADFALWSAHRNIIVGIQWLNGVLLGLDFSVHGVYQVCRAS
jgi:hypothetical protein